MDNLYTVITEYAGGTYISQVRSKHIDFVLKAWELKLSEKDLQDWRLHRGEVQEIVASKVVPLKGLQNV